MPPLRPAPIVHKFGGAALADATAIREAARIVALQQEAAPAVVVASAMRGVTDALLRVARTAPELALEDPFAELRDRHAAVAVAVANADAAAGPLLAELHGVLDAAAARLAGGGWPAGDAALDDVLAVGERLSARLLVAALRAQGVPAEYVDATCVVRACGPHGAASPDAPATLRGARRWLRPLVRRGVVPVVPGFLAALPSGAVATLGRGGSDLTATLLGRVLRAREVMLWKDVPGMLTADPRVVPGARLIPVLHAREASELAYHGARVLHPRALIALGGRTRLRVRPFAEPEAAGTRIVTGGRGSRAGRAVRLPVKALAVIEHQALVTVAGNGMAGVPGIAARAFGALERLGVSVSLISQASSEHSICIGIAGSAATAATAALREAFADEIARREVDGIEQRDEVATVGVVGLGMAGTPGIAGRLFTALADAGVNVVAIAQGDSELNISVVVAQRDAAVAQRAVHAAFQLDRIGGGSAAAGGHTDVVLLGFGQIGREVAAQLANGGGARRGIRVVAAVDRAGYVLEPTGLGSRRLAKLAAAKRDGRSMAQAAGGVAAAPADALRAIAGHALSRPVLVDVTADDTGALLAAAAAQGMDLVLANKRPLADGAAARALAVAVAASGRRLRHEATVGAGLPIIDTIHKLVDSGDRVLRIQGCPSGTLGYLFGELGRGVPFSTALRAAMALGYTEPDPRDDLSGMDVARKALILGRLLGFTGELGDVRVQSLVPSSLRDLPRDGFLARLERLDGAWARRVERALARGTVLRYRATVSARRVRVGVVAVPAASALGALTGTDNQFAFTTRRYRATPLVITGAGAGAAVTAAGVVNDVQQLAERR